METLYLVIIIVLFVLAISDLIVGVSNDAVNFLNSAVGSKATTFRVILLVAALGIIVGSTFSSGMMEVARKGIFHPEQFFFAELMILFLAVMVTDVILLDAFNTFGMPTSTTVSIVFELLGAAVALSVIKIYSDPEALGLGEYINTDKALAIIAGILLSVVFAFTIGAIIQYLTRLLFSFDYEKKLKYFGSIWGGISIAAITYFLLVKGSKGASFMTEEFKEMIFSNTFLIIGASFIFWAIILQFIIWFTKFNILRLIVIIGTFALAMAFAGNDLVNFIGVPLAGYNSYEIWQNSNGTSPELLSMGELAGQVPTPTILLIIAGVIMTITLWTSKKARSVVKTSLDLGRQYDGAERFASYGISRSLVRVFTKAAKKIDKLLPAQFKNSVSVQFDQKPFIAAQAKIGSDAPSFDLLRASVTLVVASIVITIGTNWKLPLSTTYVTFMVFMGASLADGAWSRESAVYRVSGVLSVIGGWFFTALAAFSLAFILANIFYFGGSIAILIIIALVCFAVFRSHLHHGKRQKEEDESNLEESNLTTDKLYKTTINNTKKILEQLIDNLENTLFLLKEEDLSGLKKKLKGIKEIHNQVDKIRKKGSKYIEKSGEDEINTIHLYLLVADYLYEIVDRTKNIVRNSLEHVDNNHKPLIDSQFQEITFIQKSFRNRIQSIIQVFDEGKSDQAKQLHEELPDFIQSIRTARKNQIKRIKNHETGTRNSILYLSILSEYRNLALFSNRLLKILDDLILTPEKEEIVSKKIK